MITDATQTTSSAAPKLAAGIPFVRADWEVLRRLAGRVAELAARPIEQEKRDRWYRHNALQPTRPVIFCDPENGWHEIIRPEHLECQHLLARHWEWQLRRYIFWGESMRDDFVIPAVFNLSHVHTISDWGLHETRIGGLHGGSFVWEAPLKTYEDVSLLHFPTITIDEAETQRRLELAHTILGDLLPVRLKTSWWWSSGLTRVLAELRGLEQILYDMSDCPDDLHRLMAFLRDGHLAMLDDLEQRGLLTLNNDGTYVGSGGFGWSRELPRSDFDGHVRTCDQWGFAESQETVGVSPRMFAEFVFPYQAPILQRYGLTCYGCCEPLDKRIEIIKQLPNLRRVSVSPWANLSCMAEALTDRYIYSMKPSPSDLATDVFDEDHIRATIREALSITRGCHVEVIMKDCHTIGNDPQRVIRWVQIAREEAETL